MNTTDQPSENQWQLMDIIGAIIALAAIVSLSVVVYHMSRHYTDRRVSELIRREHHFDVRINDKKAETGVRQVYIDDAHDTGNAVEITFRHISGKRLTINWDGTNSPLVISDSSNGFRGGWWTADWTNFTFHSTSKLDWAEDSGNNVYTKQSK